MNPNLHNERSDNCFLQETEYGGEFYIWVGICSDEDCEGSNCGAALQASDVWCAV